VGIQGVKRRKGRQKERESVGGRCKGIKGDNGKRHGERKRERERERERKRVRVAAWKQPQRCVVCK